MKIITELSDDPQIPDKTSIRIDEFDVWDELSLAWIIYNWIDKFLETDEEYIGIPNFIYKDYDLCDYNEEDNKRAKEIYIAKIKKVRDYFKEIADGNDEFLFDLENYDGSEHKTTKEVFALFGRLFHTFWS